MAQRRLAAIMFTDIVGYDSLLKEDEKKAFEALRKNQRIHRRLIKKFNGRWLKEMGRGTLASFSSIIDAVMCSLSIQKATSELNIPIRIGIHLGEVIFEKKDVLGDGVNIASRIHSLIDIHGIVVSEKVYSDIKNKEGLELESIGTQTLKGVDTPVGIYKVSCTDDSLLDFTIDTGELIRPLSFGRTTIVAGILIIALLAFALYYFLPKFTQSSSELGKSVLILPFNNYLGTDTLDYFVAGMHDALISDIGKVSALNVKSKTTANAIKNANKSIPEIAEELGINTFIETGVLCIGDSICLQMKIFDEEENEIWIRDFKAERSQILNLYSKITKDIADRINVALTPEEEQLLAKSRTIDKEVYDAYLKGYSYIEDLSHESLLKARDYLNRAIEKDPDWAPLYAAMATIWLSIGSMAVESPEIAVPIVYENLNKAIELNPDLAEAHYVSASMAWTAEWDWEKAEKEFLKALSINPNHALSRIHYSHMLYILQRPEEGSAQANRAYKLDPLNPIIQSTYGLTLLCERDCASAVSVLENLLASDPDNFLANNVIDAAAFQCGDLNRVFEAEKHLHLLLLEEGVMNEIEKIYNEKGFYTALEESMCHLEVLAEKVYVCPADMAFKYYMINQDDKSMEWIEKGAEVRDPTTLYIGTGYLNFIRLYDNPRFIEVLEKMNLPLP